MKNFVYALLVVLLMYSCKSNDAESEPVYIPTTIPDDATELIKNISEGSSLAPDTVILVVQGGPMAALVDAEEAIQTTGDKSLASRYQMYLVHQVQTFNESVLNTNLSFEQITLEAIQSAAMLQKVVEHFKAENNTVLIWGYSYGFFVIEDLLVRQEMKFDRAFLGGGRLDMTEEVWRSFSRGIPVSFESDGVTISQQNLEGENFASLAKFAAALGQNHYTELLKEIELSQDKILFYFGGKDRSVGRPTAEELSFLNSKNALYIFDENIGHNISPANARKIIEFLLTGEKP